MIKDNLESIKKQLPSGVQLVAVSKFHPIPALMAAYAAGQRLFGENRPQELASKVSQMPADAKWHFIGHLQTNKLKLVLPYVQMVQSVDSLHLLQAINKWCGENSKHMDILLEFHIGAEETKQGFYEEEVLDILFNADKYPHVHFCGLMGMASHTDDEELIRADFSRIASFKDYINDLFPELEDFTQLSIGMSDDWKLAIEYGSTIIRVGTSIFGQREY